MASVNPAPMPESANIGPIRNDTKAVKVMKPPRVRLPAKIWRAARYMMPALTTPNTNMLDAPMIDIALDVFHPLANMRSTPAAKVADSRASAP